MYDNLITVILLILIVTIYLLPTVIAFGRDVSHRHTIAVINILFGWTLIAWLICFVWALLAETAIDEYA